MTAQDVLIQRFLHLHVNTEISWPFLLSSIGFKQIYVQFSLYHTQTFFPDEYIHTVDVKTSDNRLGFNLVKQKLLPHLFDFVSVSSQFEC